MSKLSPVVSVLLVITMLKPTTAAVQGKSELIQVVNDHENEELIFYIGPIDLPAGASHHLVKQPPLLTATVPIDAYLYAFDVEMLAGDGQPMTNRVLHHVNLIDPDHRELFSPIARRLFAASSETPPASLPRVLGIRVEKDQQLVVSAMFHNPTEQSYPGARLKVTLRYRTEGLVFPIGVYPVYIDVMGPIGEKDFDLPVGRFEQYWEGSPAIDGRLLAAGGHMHDHATSLEFADVTTGKVLWKTGPTLDENRRVVAVPVGKFWWKGGIPLKADHTYRLTVVYNNPGQPLVNGGMGVLGGIFLPSRGAEWPRLDPQNPDYVTNMEKTRLTAERRAMGMMAGEGESGEHAAGSHGH